MTQGPRSSITSYALATHFICAVTFGPFAEGLSAALVADGQTETAIRAYEQGIAVAERRGDVQAAKEMKVFLKRLGRAG